MARLVLVAVCALVAATAVLADFDTACSDLNINDVNTCANACSNNGEWSTSDGTSSCICGFTDSIACTSGTPMSRNIKRKTVSPDACVADTCDDACSSRYEIRQAGNALQLESNGDIPNGCVCDIGEGPADRVVFSFDVWASIEVTGKNQLTATVYSSAVNCTGVYEAAGISTAATALVAAGVALARFLW